MSGENYAITFDGFLFHGYERQQTNDAYENERLDKLEYDQKENQTNMERLTTWIAVGTIAAGSYSFFEILKWTFHHFHLKLLF